MKRIVDGEGAWLKFVDTIELTPAIDYVTIQTKVKTGEFSDGMGRCGQERFNIRRVDDRDIQTVRRLADPVSGTWDAILRLTTGESTEE